MSDFQNDVFDPQISFVIEEASGDVDGKHVLGKVSGTFFVPNGASRNKRWYPDLVWEKQLSLPNIKEMLSSRRMLGTISHEQKLDDTAVLEGKVSHVTTKLELRQVQGGKQGYGEALILDTPAGRILNTFTRAGVKLYTSSRANGKFKGTHEGLPSVDPDSFQLSGFDFVLDPGFLEAKPELVESLKESMDKLLNISIKDSSTTGGNNDEGDPKMGEKNHQELLESAYKENGQMKSDLTAALNENDDLKSKNVDLNSKVSSLEESVKKINEAMELAEKYKELGTPEEISEALDLAEAQRKAYEPLGTPEEIDEALDMGRDLVEKYIPLGTPEEIDEALDLAKEIKGKYDVLGTPEEIDEAFTCIEKFMNEQNEAKNSVKVKELAEELGVPEKSVSEIYTGDEAKVREFFQDLSETVKFKNKFRKNEVKTEEVKDTKKSLFNKTDGEYLMESLT